MKSKVFVLLLAIVLSLTACSTTNNNIDTTSTFSDSVMRQEVKYIKKYVDWEPYHTVDDLISQSDIVVIGEVTDISFMTHDNMMYTPPESKKDKVLCTVYDLKISNVYKGEVGDNIKLKISGGIENAAYTDEQISVLGNQTVTEITICVEEPTFEIGQTYLLVLREYEDFIGFYYPVGYYQGVCQIVSNFQKNEDSLGFSDKDIISFFGEEIWADYKSSNYIETE